MFSHWQTNYDGDNEKVTNHKKENKFEIPTMTNHFKKRYHNYHHTFYDTDMAKGIGLHGDNPRDKFQPNYTKQVKGKLHSDNYDIGKGSSKATNYIPGYSGHMPYNPVEPFKTAMNDPYFGKAAKSNHILNYKVKLIGYQGHIPTNPNNIKGNVRPYCLEKTGESFA